jgi:hypothetical protein
MSTTVDTGTEIASFNVEISRDQIDDLRRRIEATRWPNAELVEDACRRSLSGASRATGRGLRLRRLEARLNACLST